MTPNPFHQTSRRQPLATVAAASVSARVSGQDSAKSPTVRQITHGPGFHGFGYYDKLRFSPDYHPRLSRDERTVCIDSPHAGQGRQFRLIGISAIV